MFRAYLQELTNEVLPLGTERNFAKYLKDRGDKVLTTATGFMAYRLQGDAMIIDEMYVKPEFRKSYECLKMFQTLLKLAEEANKNVLIGFSEPRSNKNPLPGIKAMESVGFKKVQSLNDGTQVFLRGI